MCTSLRWAMALSAFPEPALLRAVKMPAAYVGPRLRINLHIMITHHNAINAQHTESYCPRPKFRTTSRLSSCSLSYIAYHLIVLLCFSHGEPHHQCIDPLGLDIFLSVPEGAGLQFIAHQQSCLLSACWSKGGTPSCLMPRCSICYSNTDKKIQRSLSSSLFSQLQAKPLYNYSLTILFIGVVQDHA